MKINKISSKLIKPHTPTPQNLKSYTISFLDQHVGTMNIAVVLYYQSKPDDDVDLEESLSRILVQFHPLAGRYIKNDHMVDCSDEGAEYVRAEALDVELLDLVGKTETEQLVPDQYFRLDEAADNPLLSIQVTTFPRGGVTMAISVSHRVFDVSSLETFITAWLSATNPHKTVRLLTRPSFALASLLPHKDGKFGLDSSQCQSKAQKTAVRKVVFNKEALASLKSKIKVGNVERMISRVRVVCAVIAKSLIGLDRAKHGRYRDFVIFQPVNMRRRTLTPPPENACGNFSFGSFTRRVTASEAGELGVGELVDLIGDGVGKSIADYAEILSPERDGCNIIINIRNRFIQQVFKPETFVISFTDWSKFGFYEADFGWGTPIWTSFGPIQPRGNHTVLMSNKEGDGIEAWVHLNQNEMEEFDNDEEIKSFIN